ncbi:MAG: ThiF family adenylyltransferase [Candidatus Hodarchaeota archaeon]
MFEKPWNWSQEYWEMIGRNIGIVSIEEQGLLKESPVAIAGVGGLGGPLAKQLVRSGFEHLRVVDIDVFEPHNLNRQVCTLKDMYRAKVDVLEAQLVAINPEVQVATFTDLVEENVDDFLDGVKVATLTLDGPVGSILVSRTCKRLGIPLVESWAVPYQVAWWFLPDTKPYEACYGLGTEGMTIGEIKESPETIVAIKKAFFGVFEKFPNIAAFYSNEKGAVEAMMRGEIGLRSFCPNVRLTASNLANEVVFAGILGRLEKIIAPKVAGYDYMNKKPFEFEL